MKTTRFEGADDRLVLRAMALDPVVLAAVAAQWQPQGLFANTWGNLVGGWCCDYWERYAQAPGMALASIYQEWAVNQQDQKTAELVGSFLVSLDTDGINLPAAPYMVDMAQRLFTRVSLNRLAELVQACTTTGQGDKAIEAVEGWRKPTVGQVEGVDLLSDAKVWEQAWTEETEPVIALPGALGQFFGHQLARDALISFMAPEKTGKSFWLMELAWRAVLQGRRVAYLAVGDMSLNQMVRRFGTRIAKCPARPGVVKVPKSITVPPGDKVAQVELEEQEYHNGLTWERAHAACHPHTSSRSYPPLRLVARPANSTSVRDIRGLLRSWERDAWVPDVLVVDYADILVAPPGMREEREWTNYNWQALRGISQELHCLVLTATQTDAESYSTWVLTKSNFSIDKRKLAHVNGMIGINMTPAEKEMDVTRLNWVVLREGEYSETRCVYVAGCRPLGTVAARSCWPTKGMAIEKKEENIPQK